MSEIHPELSPFLARIEPLRNKAAFGAAFERYCVGMLRTYRGTPILNKLVNEQGRFLISALAFQLHLERDPAVPASGLTIARLVSLSAAHGVASGGRVKTFVALMRLGGFLEPVPGAGDRRSKVLAPTTRMLDHVRVYTVIQMRCLDALFERGYAARLAADPGFLERFHRFAGGYFLRGARLPDAFPELAVFTGVDAGYSILLHMLRALPAVAGRPRPAAIDVPHGPTARRFGVSRGHVANLMGAVATAGFVTIRGSGGKDVFVEPPLIDLAERWFAAQMALMDAAAEAAAGPGADVAAGLHGPPA